MLLRREEEDSHERREEPSQWAAERSERHEERLEAPPLMQPGASKAPGTTSLPYLELCQKGAPIFSKGWELLMASAAPKAPEVSFHTAYPYLELCDGAVPAGLACKYKGLETLMASAAPKTLLDVCGAALAKEGRDTKALLLQAQRQQAAPKASTTVQPPAAAAAAAPAGAYPYLDLCHAAIPAGATGGYAALEALMASAAPRTLLEACAASLAKDGRDTRGIALLLQAQQAKAGGTSPAPTVPVNAPSPSPAALPRGPLPYLRLCHEVAMQDLSERSGWHALMASAVPRHPRNDGLPYLNMCYGLVPAPQTSHAGWELLMASAAPNWVEVCGEALALGGRDATGVALLLQAQRQQAAPKASTTVQPPAAAAAAAPAGAYPYLDLCHAAIPAGATGGYAALEALMASAAPRTLLEACAASLAKDGRDTRGIALLLQAQQAKAGGTSPAPTVPVNPPSPSPAALPRGPLPYLRLCHEVAMQDLSERSGWHALMASAVPRHPRNDGLPYLNMCYGLVPAPQTSHAGWELLMASAAPNWVEVCGEALALGGRDATGVALLRQAQRTAGGPAAPAPRPPKRLPMASPPKRPPTAGGLKDWLALEQRRRERILRQEESGRPPQQQVAAMLKSATRLERRSPGPLQHLQDMEKEHRSVLEGQQRRGWREFVAEARGQPQTSASPTSRGPKLPGLTVQPPSLRQGRLSRLEDQWLQEVTPTSAKRDKLQPLPPPHPQHKLMLRRQTMKEVMHLQVPSPSLLPSHPNRIAIGAFVLGLAPRRPLCWVPEVFPILFVGGPSKDMSRYGDQKAAFSYQLVGNILAKASPLGHKVGHSACTSPPALKIK